MELYEEMVLTVRDQIILKGSSQSLEFTGFPVREGNQISESFVHLDYVDEGRIKLPIKLLISRY